MRDKTKQNKWNKENMVSLTGFRLINTRLLRDWRTQNIEVVTRDAFFQRDAETQFFRSPNFPGSLFPIPYNWLKPMAKLGLRKEAYQRLVSEGLLLAKPERKKAHHYQLIK